MGVAEALWHPSTRPLWEVVPAHPSLMGLWYAKDRRACRAGGAAPGHGPAAAAGPGAALPWKLVYAARLAEAGHPGRAAHYVASVQARSPYPTLPYSMQCYW